MVLTSMLPANWDKYVYTAIICLNHIALGICITAMSPVMVEMKDILNTSMASITLYSTFLAIGFILGSVIVFSFKYINRQIVLIVSITAMSLSIGFMPHSPDLTVLFTLTLITGVGSAIVNIVANVWLTELWQVDCAPILQIPGFTFGIGTVLSPVILRPYLLNKINNSTSNYTEIGSSPLPLTTTESYDMNFENERRQLLKTPFLVMAFIQMIFPYLLGIMFILKRYRSPALAIKPLATIDKNKNFDRNVTAMVSKESVWSDKLFDRQSKRVRMTVIVLATAMVSIYTVCENAFLVYFDTYYQFSPLKLTATKSAEVIIAFSSSYTAFRFVCIWIALKLSPNQMLFSNFIVCAIGIVCLVFARHSLVMVWVTNVLMGVGTSAVVPAFYALVAQYISLNDNLGALFQLSASASNMLLPYLLGWFIEKFSIIFIIYTATTLGLGIVFYAFIVYFIFKYSIIDKISKSQQSL